MTCAPATSFVTILDGGYLLPQLRCMRDRLSSVRSACPLLVVAHGSAALTGGPVEALQALVGKSNVMRSSQLLNQRTRNATAPMGRRLYTDARAFFSGTMIVKLHLWVLTGYKRLAFLDLDVVIVSNPDTLLSLPITYDSVAAVPAKACKRANAFNSGVLVFAPQREVLRAMLLRACIYFWQAAHARAHVVAMLHAALARDAALREAVAAARTVAELAAALPDDAGPLRARDRAAPDAPAYAALLARGRAERRRAKDAAMRANAPAAPRRREPRPW